MDIYTTYETMKARNDIPTGNLRKDENTPLLSLAIIWDFSPSSHCIVAQDYFLPVNLSANC